jgi:tetratricopeptide (TPR) repeat protein
MGDLDKAIADYTAALEHNTEFADAYNNRGDVLARRGKLGEAIADFSEAIRISPDELQAYENRGDVQFRQKKFELALADYSELIRRTLDLAVAGGSNLSPGAKLARVYRKRSATLFRVKRFDEALADADEAIRLNPDDADAYTLRYQLYLEKGRVSEADADRQRAASLLLRQLPP